MPGKSNIEWTETTWNPVTGCSKVSPGCAHCYAETLTRRYAGAAGWPETFLPWTPENAEQNVVIHKDRIHQPSRWIKPRMIFVNSMSDLLHENIPDIYVEMIIDEMERASHHTYQVLTKRATRMREILQRRERRKLDYANAFALCPTEEMRTSPAAKDARKRAEAGPPKHIWWGVTVENQRWADERIPILLDTPAAVRFISAEPLLGPLDLKPYLYCQCNAWSRRAAMRQEQRDNEPIHSATCPISANGSYRKLGWVIIGGESGPHHRTFDPEWARDLVRQCRDAGVPAFMKQMGGNRPGNKLEDLPEDLRVREFPVLAVPA